MHVDLVSDSTHTDEANLMNYRAHEVHFHTVSIFKAYTVIIQDGQR